jgi:predicted NBD/HSP70 family sugar kinase
MPPRSATTVISTGGNAPLSSEQAKRHRLLRQLHRRGTDSRVHLARELRISNSRVCDLIDEMVRERLLEEDAAGDRRGRRGVNVRLNPRYGHFVGFDMEAKRLRLVLTDFTGTVVWQTRTALRPFKSRAALLDTLMSFIDDAMAKVRGRAKRILGYGLAASGVIDTRRGVILHYDPIPAAADLPLRDLIADRVGLPCTMENNIRAMTLAEWTAGAAQGLDTFVCMAVRSGVGAGVVINGQLLPGSHGFAGETGYMDVTGAGCAGTWKNFQQTVSESALGVDVEASDFSLPEPVAKRTGEVIAAQVASLAAVLDPQAFVLGGTLLKSDGPVWPHVERAYREVALSELADQIPLLPAKLGPFAAAQGAAYRCLYELFPVTPAAAT